MKLTILFAVFFFLNCSNKSNNDEISAVIEKIIITKEPIPQINFLVKFENKSNKDLILFNNLETKRQKYISAGLMLKIKNDTIPIGVVVNDTHELYINKKSISKYLYVYPNRYIFSPEYSNKISSTEELSKIAKDARLFYKYDKIGDEKLINGNIYRNSFIVTKGEIPVEFKNHITTEELYKMINGMIIEKE